MRRLTHHQYTRISMIEDLIEELELDEKIGLYVDTWRPASETWTRVALVDEEAVYAVDGSWYSQTIAGLMLAEDGGIIGDEGGVFRLDDGNEITLAELREWLTGYTTED